MISVVIAVCLVLQFAVLPYHEVYALSEDFRDFVENELAIEGRHYLLTQIDQIKLVLVSCKEDLNIRADECNKLMVGNPFVVYNEDQNVQEQILYYPIAVTDTKKVVAVISLMNTTVGWQYCIDTDWADELNQSHYMQSQEDFIFYFSNEKFVVQKSKDDDQKSKNILAAQEFDDKSFESKKQIMKAKMRNWRKINVEENRKDTSLLKYTPGVTDELGHFYCNIEGAQGQGSNTRLCWAASVATIINYRMGTTYSAKNIATVMGIDPMSGASVYQSASALRYFGLDYSAFLSTMSFNSIMTELNIQFPFIVSGNSATGNAHAVTAYGYRNLKDGKYVILWNPEINNGQGGVTISEYKSSGMTFTTGNIAYTWSRTVKANHVSYK